MQAETDLVGLQLTSQAFNLNGDDDDDYYAFLVSNLLASTVYIISQ